MKNKIKGFTLVELLAVIVVLAIIFAIAVPRVISVIEEADRAGFKSTGEGLIKGAKEKQGYETTQLPPEKTSTITNGAFVGDSIPMIGKLPDNGTIRITDTGKVTIGISNSKWCGIKYDDDEELLVRKDSVCELQITENVADSCFSRTNNGSEVTITSYSGSCSKNPKIPSILDGLPVTTIAAYAFSMKQLTSVKIPSSVKTIMDLAFARNNLTSITIPTSVTSVINGAFNDNLLNDDLAFIYARNPDGTDYKKTVVSYGGAKKDNVIVPQNVEIIGQGAFSNTRLNSVILPDNLKNISRNSFQENMLTSIIIPNTVTSIGMYAFYGNQISNISLSSSLVNIDDFAFIENQLTNLTIPDSVTTIGQSAFDSNLIETLSLGNGVTSIGYFAFGNNLLTSLVIPDNVTNMEWHAFNGNILTDITIGSGLNTLKSYVFNSNQLTSVVIPNNITKIEDYALGNNDLRSIVIPSNVQLANMSISSAFYNVYYPNRIGGTYSTPYSQYYGWVKE